MKFNRMLLIYCLAGLGILVGCAPQALPTVVPLVTELEPDMDTTVPLPASTLQLPAATPEPEALLQPAYPAENQAESGKGFVRGSLEIEESGVIVLDDPLRVELNLAGFLPTPCHELAWEVAPAVRGVIQIEVFTEIDPEVICVQVLEPFEERIELKRLLPGDYTVFVNGEQAGAFTLEAPAGYP